MASKTNFLQRKVVLRMWERKYSITVGDCFAKASVGISQGSDNWQLSHKTIKQKYAGSKWSVSLTLALLPITLLHTPPSQTVGSLFRVILEEAKQSL